MTQHFISTDKHLNPELKKQVSELRGSILGQAEKNTIPDWIMATPCKNQPSIIIANLHNGHNFECPLFAYGQVRKALAELL